MTTPSLVINVYGGLVQDVFASDPNVEVTLVDWDVEGADAHHPDVISITDRQGRTRPAYVASLPVNSLERLADTDVSKALAAVECAV